MLHRHPEQISSNIWWWVQVIAISLIWLLFSPSLAYLLWLWLSCQQELFHTGQKIQSGWHMALCKAHNEADHLRRSLAGWQWLVPLSQEPQLSKLPNNYYLQVNYFFSVFYKYPYTHSLLYFGKSNSCPWGNYKWQSMKKEANEGCEGPSARDTPYALTYGSGAIPSSMINLPGATFLKEKWCCLLKKTTASSSPARHRDSWDPCHLEPTMTDLIMCRSCTGSHSCWELWGPWSSRVQRTLFFSGSP